MTDLRHWHTSRDKLRCELATLQSAQLLFEGATQRLLERAGHERLRNQLHQTLRRSPQQSLRLESAREELSDELDIIECQVTRALIAAGERALEQIEANDALGDCVIAVAQLKSHYSKKASYRSLIIAAQISGCAAAAALLRENLLQDDDDAHALEKLLPELEAKVVFAEH